MTRIVTYFCLLFIFAIGFRNISGNPVSENGKMPAMARKAGGNWRPELTTQSSQPETKLETSIVPEKVKSEAEQENDNSDYEYSESEEEPVCPRGKYYNWRRGKCVRKPCSGRTLRGVCLNDIAGYDNDRRGQQPTDSGPQYVHRRGSVGSQTRHMTFLGKKKGPFTG